MGGWSSGRDGGVVGDEADDATQFEMQEKCKPSMKAVFARERGGLDGTGVGP